MPRLPKSLLAPVTPPLPARLGVDPFEPRDCPAALGGDDHCGSTVPGRWPVPPRDEIVSVVSVAMTSPVTSPLTEAGGIQPTPFHEVAGIGPVPFHGTRVG
jgi:hypothetical protein